MPSEELAGREAAAPVFQYVYVSSAVELFSDDQLRELLEHSRERNLACHVTGLLLYIRGNFIQLLEGRREDVMATRDRIADDPQHRGMITLLQADASRRDFPDWAMGFERVEAPEAARIPGFSDFLESGSPDLERTGALKLLDFFRELNVGKQI